MIGKAMVNRASRYNQSLAFIRNPPQNVTVRVIAPPETFSVKRLTMSKRLLDEGYTMGRQQGEEHLASRQGVHGLTADNCHFCF